MRLKLRLASAAILLSASLSSAQEIENIYSADLLARLSFNNSANVHSDQSQNVCMSVSRSGVYRILRFGDDGKDGKTVRLEGRLSQKELQAFKALLDAPAFLALSGSHGGLIRQWSESFAAEIPEQPKAGKVQAEAEPGPARRLQWLNADGASPFPAPVANIVDWLVKFNPADGLPLENERPSDICPSGGLRLVQPALAENNSH